MLTPPMFALRTGRNAVTKPGVVVFCLCGTDRADRPTVGCGTANRRQVQEVRQHIVRIADIGQGDPPGRVECDPIVIPKRCGPRNE